MLDCLVTEQYRQTIPAHLADSNWLEFQQATILSIHLVLCEELDKLSLKPTARHVHDSRVAIRRFLSVWSVLKQDGWETKKFRRKVIGKLRKLLKSLGTLRDWDVNLELGKTFSCPRPVMSEWSGQRKLVMKSVKSRVKHLNIGRIKKRLDRYIRQRPEKLIKRLSNPDLKFASTYERLDQAIRAQEEEVMGLESRACTAEELHQLRLGIKQWRYLLVEFLGITNLELTRSQQLLGRLNDYHRLAALLDAKEAEETKARLEMESQKLLAEFSLIRKTLPYGLRPLIISRIETG